MEIDEPSFLQKLVNGDTEAYTLLFREHYKNLCTYSYKFIKNMNVAEEVVQEVFLRIWEKRTTLHISENIASYLYRAVHNESLNACKNIEHENDKKNKLSAGSMQAVNFNDPLVSKELIEKLDRAINELPGKSKEIFNISRQDSLSNKEIAEKFGITVKGVEFHITKALKILRHELKEYLQIIILVI